MNLIFPFITFVLLLSQFKDSDQKEEKNVKSVKSTKLGRSCVNSNTAPKVVQTNHLSKTLEKSKNKSNSKTTKKEVKTTTTPDPDNEASDTDLKSAQDYDGEEDDIYLQLAELPDPNDFNLANCGITRKRSGQIVGGDKAVTGEFPWIVSFQKLKNKVNYLHFCGGAILNQRWILTASHCFQGASHSIKKMKAVVGSLQWKGNDSQSYGIEKIINHEDFDLNVYANDISLVKTSEPIKIIETKSQYIVNSVCVPSNTTEPTDTAMVYGWGLLSENGETSSDLMKVQVTKYDKTKCNQTYAEFVGSLTPQMMCYLSSGKDACKGDSGGPLSQVIKRRGTQIGIVSFGNGCARDKVAGVYQEVAQYYNWIYNTIKRNA